jgi:hypothetical protein
MYSAPATSASPPKTSTASRNARTDRANAMYLCRIAHLPLRGLGRASTPWPHLPLLVILAASGDECHLACRWLSVKAPSRTDRAISANKRIDWVGGAYALMAVFRPTAMAKAHVLLSWSHSCPARRISARHSAAGTPNLDSYRSLNLVAAAR